jgi:hypothetical protein
VCNLAAICSWTDIGTFRRRSRRAVRARAAGVPISRGFDKAAQRVAKIRCVAFFLQTTINLIEGGAS